MTIAEIEAKIAELTPKERELWNHKADADQATKKAIEAWMPVWNQLNDLKDQLKIERAVAERLTKSL